MVRPLRKPTTVRPLSAATVHRKLRGEDKIDPELELKKARPDTDADTEVMLARLEVVAKIENDAKAERERLRDKLTPILVDGSRIFLAPDGSKHFAFNVAQELTVVDAELLKQLVDPEIYDEVTVEKVDLDKFKVAQAAGRIPDDVLVKVVTFKPKKPYVKFGVATQ